MSNSDDDSDQKIVVELNEAETEAGSGSEGPLLVAMQPGVDVPAAVEVVVVTAEGALQIATNNDLLDSDNGQVVSVAAVEEVKNEISDEYEGYSARTRASLVSSDIKGVVASARSAPHDSSDDELQSSSDENDLEQQRSSRRIPKKREFAYRLQWRNKEMIEAMKAVTDKKMTIRGAAKKFSVPYSTLKDRVHGRVQHGTKPGVKTVLSPEEEEELVKYVKDMESAGFELRCIDVRDRAGEILQLNHGHNTPYKDHSPGHNWFSGFVKRNPVGMEFKKVLNRNIVPSVNKQKLMCKRFFENAAHLYKRFKLTSKPERIYTVKEIPLSGVVDASLIACASADGEFLPPFVIFTGQRVKLTSARSAYPDAFFTCSYTGRVTDLVMLWWFRDHFLKKVTTGHNRPVVLLTDRPVRDITFQLVQLAREERVHLLCMPQGVSHLLQPLDDVFGNWLESCIGRKAKKWTEENPGTPFTQKVLAHMMQKIWRKYMSPEDIKEKFFDKGIFPLNSSLITSDKIATAAYIIKESKQYSPPSDYPNYSNGDEYDSPFAGLSLLSTLSTHEIASLDNKRQNSAESSNIKDNSDVSIDSPPKKRRRKRYRYPSEDENYEDQTENVEIDFETTVPHDENLQGDETVTITYGEPVPTDAELQIIQQAIKEATRKGIATEEPTLTEKLVASKNDRDQINRAIESIGGDVAQADSSPASSVAQTSAGTHQVENVATRLSRRLLEKSPIKSPIHTTKSARTTPKRPTEQSKKDSVVKEGKKKKVPTATLR